MSASTTSPYGSISPEKGPKPVPHLPLEIWHNIASHINGDTDLAMAWFSLRLLWGSSKKAIESRCAKHILPRMKLAFLQNSSAGLYRFCELSEDGEAATFVEIGTNLLPRLPDWCWITYGIELCRRERNDAPLRPSYAPYMLSRLSVVEQLGDYPQGFAARLPDRNPFNLSSARSESGTSARGGLPWKRMLSLALRCPVGQTLTPRWGICWKWIMVQRLIRSKTTIIDIPSQGWDSTESDTSSSDGDGFGLLG